MSRDQLAGGGARRQALLCVLAACSLVVTGVGAASQETTTSSSTSTSSSSSSSTSSTTSTTVTGGEPTTTTTAAPAQPSPPPPGDEAGSGEAPPPEESPGGEAPPEAPPDESFEVPPPEQPPSVDLQRVRQVVARQLRRARQAAAEAEAARVGAEEAVERARQHLEELKARRAELRAEQRRALRRLQHAKLEMRELATQAFVRGPFTELTTMLESQDPNDLVRRMQLIKSALDADQAAVDEYRAAKAALSREAARLVDRTITATEELDQAEVNLFVLSLAAGDAAEQVEMYEAGSSVAVAGFVFPVGEPHSFVDTFLAPRMPGTPYEHLHQGTDIFAPAGTPLYACERAIVTRMGTDVLGGTKLWLVGASGNRYYYAHLSAFAEGLVDGMAVEAGDVIGYVGDSGNARGGAAHLHFEIHPGGGPAVNPWPILQVIDDAARRR